MVLVPLLGSPAKEAVLLYILTHGEAYPTEVAVALRRALVVVQNQLSRLEHGDIVVSRLRGKVRLYQLNPRYPFRKELERLLWRALEFYPADEREELYVPRLRPRKPGRPLARRSSHT